MTECYRLLQTEEFKEWLDGESARSHYQIDTRLARLRLDGHFGTIKNVSNKDKGAVKDQVWNSSSMTVDEFITPTFLNRIFYYC